MSQIFKLKPSLVNDLMLKPCTDIHSIIPSQHGGEIQRDRHCTCVGVMVVMSSSLRHFKIVVLPALSSPRTRMRACTAQWKGTAPRKLARFLRAAKQQSFTHFALLLLKAANQREQALEKRAATWSTPRPVKNGYLCRLNRQMRGRMTPDIHAKSRTMTCCQVQAFSRLRR